MDEKQKQSVKAEKNNTSSPKKVAQKKSSNEEFKRKYFEFYDDVKISDRQDW